MARGNKGRSLWRALVRPVQWAFDALRAGPLGILVFASSAALLLHLQLEAGGVLRAQAVASGLQIEQPARVASFVTAVYVRPGDVVDEGTPLVELSPHFIDLELARLDAEVERLMREAQLAQARLLVEEQRWLDPKVRVRPTRPSLEAPTQELYAKELAVLKIRRRQLLGERSGLTVKSDRSGRIVHVVPTGTAVAEGTAVASLVKEFAEEIVAYVPASTQPNAIEVGAKVRIARPTRVCSGTGEVLRRGAAVEMAPGQLHGLLRSPLHGMPVFISVPAGCDLGIGQTLTVEFARLAM